SSGSRSSGPYVLRDCWISSRVTWPHLFLFSLRRGGVLVARRLAAERSAAHGAGRCLGVRQTELRDREPEGLARDLAPCAAPALFPERVCLLGEAPAACRACHGDPGDEGAHRLSPFQTAAGAGRGTRTGVVGR